MTTKRPVAVTFPDPLHEAESAKRVRDHMRHRAALSIHRRDLQDPSSGIDDPDGSITACIDYFLAVTNLPETHDPDLLGFWPDYTKAVDRWTTQLRTHSPLDTGMVIRAVIWAKEQVAEKRERLVLD